MRHRAPSGVTRLLDGRLQLGRHFLARAEVLSDVRKARR